MDEPLSALDRMTKDEILPFFERLTDSLDLPIVYVSHDIGEVARLASHVVVLRNGRVTQARSAAELLGTVDGVRSEGPDAAGGLLETTVVRHHADGITELAFSGGTLYLPRFDGTVWATVRVRVPAREVMLATVQPSGISALNVLAVEVAEIHRGGGPGALVALTCGSDRLLARVTQRSLDALGLAVGQTCFAVIKSVAIAKGNVGSAHGLAREAGSDAG